MSWIYEELNTEIKKLFDNKDGYLIPNFFSKKQFHKWSEILFVWMNPAGYPKTEENIKGFYVINGVIPENEINQIIESHEDFLDYKKYFWVFENNFWEWKYKKWNIIDLFVYRWTNQKDIELEIKKDNSIFFEQYSKIFIPLLEELNPKVVVFVNASASKFVKKMWYWNENQEIDFGNGYWKIPNKDSNWKRLPEKIIGKPVIFSWMLPWQRWLDVWTRELLKYSIEKIISER